MVVGLGVLEGEAHDKHLVLAPQSGGWQAVEGLEDGGGPSTASREDEHPVIRA